MQEHIKVMEAALTEMNHQLFLYNLNARRAGLPEIEIKVEQKPIN